MQLTRYTDYSLRVLIFLAVDSRSIATTDEVASAYGISAPHLTKVVKHLVRLGYVESSRGRNGGMRLALPPGEIVLGDVVRLSEERFSLVECLSPETSECCIQSACGLAQVMDEALRAFLSVLDRYTLADVVRRKSRLQQLLQIETSSPKPASGRRPSKQARA